MKDLQSHPVRTTRKRGSSPALPGTEEQFRLFVAGVSDYAIFLLDLDGKILTWNPGAQRIKGYRPEEIIGKHFSIFYLPEDVSQRKPEKLLAQAALRGACEEEGWRVRKGGERFWARVTVTALHDEGGRLQGYAKVTRDLSQEQAVKEKLRAANVALVAKCGERTVQIEQTNSELQAEISDRRRAEKKLEDSLQQLRALSSRVQTLREEERKKISREVHDELGQSLTAIKMDLSWLQRKLASGEEPLRQRIQSTLRIVDETVQAVRRIAAELRPGVLDDLGVAAAIEWQTQDFQARTGIQCQLRMPPDEIILDHEPAAATFRIFQEILTNIAQHAQANQVQIRLMKTAGAIILEIRDNGKGISEQQISDPRSLGLLGMKERTLLLGGQFAVHGEEGKGTTVVVQIPMEKH